MEATGTTFFNLPMVDNSVTTISLGSSPLILAMPHGGTRLSPEASKKLNKNGALLQDTDWHIEQLYRGLLPDVTIVQANFHRYQIDVNRDPSGQSLYPGQNTTALVPLTDFDGIPIWKEGLEPNATKVKELIALYHDSYHQALNQQIARLSSIHKNVVVYDCHSIRSKIPFLFYGMLPDINLGTNDGRSCPKELSLLVMDVLKEQSNFSYVENGRFKGGWTTRYYGQGNVWALQMEIAQRCYLASEQAPFAFSHLKAEKLRTLLKTILVNILNYTSQSK